MSVMRGSVRARGALMGTFAAAAIVLWGAPSAQAVFTQCPPVDADAGCQYLITVTAAGPSVARDETQPAYENEDDSLIGVQNSSPNAISALPLAAPPTELFGFESDGICNPGKGPVAPGCVPVPGSGATTCELSGVNCSFPPPPGEPANHSDGGTVGTAWPNGDRQNGYEGPTSWFTVTPGVATSGTVNFSPPIQPGASTYFSLESPPSTTGLQVGTPTTTPPAGAPPPPKLSLFGKNGIVQGLPSNKVCLSKRHFIIHLRRYPGVTYASEFVFVNRKSVPVKKTSSGQFTALIDLRGMTAGTIPVKITVITSTGSIITGGRSYKTCHRKVAFHGKSRL
jgi:hypothetical protein